MVAKTVSKAVKPLIALTLGASRPPQYRKVLEAAGARVLEVTDAQGVAEALLCDALVLSGGGDIDPALYGEALHPLTRIETGRDEWELSLVRAFVAAKKPILGICRGAQVVQVALGGTLLQHIDGHSDTAHDILIEKTSQLAAILGEAVRVNSTHHQACTGDAPGLVVAARSADGIIEALEDGADIWAVQFHPERMVVGGKDEHINSGMLPLFEAFIDKARQSMGC